jgi:NAD(P)-dependent dehydrogenase (short-subunit alcohol dehydrogenase family)
LSSRESAAPYIVKGKEMTTIAITGAARGIAYELVKAYHDDGAQVFAFCRSLDAAKELKALAQNSDGRITVLEMDVSNDVSVRAAAAATGGATIDILFNVAGVLGSFAPELDAGSSDWSMWQDVFNVMTLGPLRVLQAFLPHMSPGSKVINITSQLAASTWPLGGLYPYVAAKAALNRLMRSVAIDLRDRGIIVGVLHPGYVQTDMGGPTADILPKDSAAGIRKVSAEWTLDRSGDFLKWNGEDHPW